MKPTLVILAAGLGSRFGSCKPLEVVGPGGATAEDAHANADTLATTLGARVGNVRRISTADVAFVPPPRPQMMEMSRGVSSSQAAAETYETGEILFTAIPSPRWFRATTLFWRCATPTSRLGSTPPTPGQIRETRTTNRMRPTTSPTRTSTCSGRGGCGQRHGVVPRLSERWMGDL